MSASFVLCVTLHNGKYTVSEFQSDADLGAIINGSVQQ